MKKKLITSLASLTLILTACGEEEQAEESNDTEESEEAQGDATTGATAQYYTDLDDLEEEYDVVIVGAGGAGLAAAIQAHDEGANPVIFEKMPVAGGNTMSSSAGMNASETIFQEQEGIEDDNDLFFEETLIGGNETNDEELLRYFVDHSAEAIEWLDSIGITLDNLTQTGGMSERRTHRPTDGSAVGEYLVDGLLRNIEEREIPLFVSADVTELVEEENQVTGVEVTFDQEDERMIQSDAVIVTTGGFGANMDMVVENAAELEGYVSTNQEGTMGDGIHMIQEVSGEIIDLEEIQIHPTVDQQDGYLITEAVRGEGAILVNQEGERFYNEMDTRDAVSAAIIDLPDQFAYLVFDSELRERVPAINFYDETGLVITGEDLDSLAEEMGVPVDQLEATLEEWNEGVENGEDPTFDRSTGMDHPLTEAPYYAIAIAPGIHHTMGGVRINTEAEVLREDDTVIEGLYAAGEVVGGLHGENRIGGNAVADIIIFGRQAGVQAAEYVQ